MSPRRDTAVRRKATSITRVTVSVHQADTLRESLWFTQAHVKNTIIVTSPSDAQTAQLCSLRRLTCIVTAALYVNGSSFNKGNAIREVQTQLHTKANIGSFVLLMDADVCVPQVAWREIKTQMPKTNQLTSVISRRIFATPRHAMSNKYNTVTPQGVTTLGFFQLYQITEGCPLYPSKFKTAAVSDKVFGNYYKKRNRIVLNVFVYHLGRVGTWQGQHRQQNWSGFADKFLLQ